MVNEILGGASPCQVGMIVKDIEEAKVRWAAFLGTETPETVGVGDYAVTKTVFRGQPAPDAYCRMAFFNLDSIQLELIQPNEAPSTWREFLNEKGEGIHHYGFQVKDIFKTMEEMKAAGYELVQWGYYGGGDGAYAYFDCVKELKCVVELLCSF